MILGMVRASNLALMNIFLTESPEQTYTYKSGQSQRAIDYIAIRYLKIEIF